MEFVNGKRVVRQNLFGFYHMMLPKIMKNALLNSSLPRSNAYITDSITKLSLLLLANILNFFWHYYLKGSARFGTLGEATTNLADYITLGTSVPVSLPLKKCEHGTILQVSLK